MGHMGCWQPSVEHSGAGTGGTSAWQLCQGPPALPLFLSTGLLDEKVKILELRQPNGDRLTGLNSLY